jgi:hypothetical protein
MAFIAGGFTEITWNHPTLGTGVLFPKSSEDSTLDLGGNRSTDDANMITANGQMIDQINYVRPSFEATIANDMNSNMEAEKINALASSPVLADWTFTHQSQAVYAGKGKPVGDIQVNTNAATFSLKLAFTGKVSKIAG